LIILTGAKNEAETIYGVLDSVRTVADLYLISIDSLDQQDTELEAERFFEVVGPHTADTDAAKGDSFARSLSPENRRRDNGWEGQARPDRSGCSQEITAGDALGRAWRMMDCSHKTLLLAN
jgi:hypothetical protein